MRTEFNLLSVVKSIRPIAAIVCFSFTIPALAQEQDVAPIYSRPDVRVYKSLNTALQYPDSVIILELKGKKLREIPEGIFSLPNLKVLDLSRNKIRKLSSSVSRLKHLDELNLSSNKIDSLPAEIGELDQLKKLSLNRNIIRTLPPEIGKMIQLHELELWDNELGDLPDEIKNLRNLRKLELRGILLSEEQQQRFRELLPNARILMSPSCNCKTR